MKRIDQGEEALRQSVMERPLRISWKAAAGPIVAAVVLAACVAGPTATPSPLPPTPTPTYPLATATPTMVASPTVAATPTIVATPMVAASVEPEQATPTPTYPLATATPTMVASPTVAATPTIVATPTVAAPVEPEQATRAVINDVTFSLEVAADSASRVAGLSNRDSLPRDAAMLFVFQSERILAFWMKDTLIPLDILFIDSDLRIVDIQTMHPQPGVPASDLRRYRPPSPVLYAIEINAGLAQTYGFQVGATIVLR